MPIWLVVYLTGLVIQMLSTIAIRDEVRDTARRFSWPLAVFIFGGAVLVWPVVVLVGAAYGVKGVESIR